MGLIIAVAFLFISLVLVLLQLPRQAASPLPLPVTAEWIDALSMARYRPMLCLLDGEDVQFLRNQPGFTPRVEAKFRIHRCKIFRGYLRLLNDDFKRICLAVKVLIVQSDSDRLELASLLLRSQIMFAYRLMIIRSKLVCYRFGVGTVDVTHLLKVFDGMRIELRVLVPAESDLLS